MLNEKKEKKKPKPIDIDKLNNWNWWILKKFQYGTRPIWVYSHKYGYFL